MLHCTQSAFLIFGTIRRIRSLEAHVAEIRASQSSIQNALAEIVGHLRGGATFTRSSVPYQSPYNDRSPSMQSMGSPPMSATPTGGTMDMGHNMQPPMSVHAVNNFGHNRASLPPVITGTHSHQHRNSIRHSNVMSPVQGQTAANNYHPPQLPPSFNNFSSSSSSSQIYNSSGSSQAPVLPPFSSLQGGTSQSNMSSIRYSCHRDSGPSSASGSKRTAPPSSNVTSADSTDNEDDDDGELPASGLVAPWEVLRNLANVAIQREAKVYNNTRH